MRQIALDTETTGLSTAEGHRILEVAGIEIVNRKFTGRQFHYYINPQREVEEEALRIHGLSNEFLLDKPLFGDIAQEFIEFIDGAELIIHNAPFDVGFLNNEFKLLNKKSGVITDYCTVLDTLVMARNMYPGQRNTLDALCKRFEVDNSQRDLHGALIDADLLIQVYLLMTGGQTGLELGGLGNDASGNAQAEPIRPAIAHVLPVLQALTEETEQHSEYLEFLEKVSKGECVWLKNNH
jgi:DNA polymerase-3 subunit epsilon